MHFFIFSERLAHETDKPMLGRNGGRTDFGKYYPADWKLKEALLGKAF